MKFLKNVILFISGVFIMFAGCKSTNVELEKEENQPIQETGVIETIPFPKTITPSEDTYCGTWSSSQYSSEGNMPTILLAGNSLRQIIKTTIEGEYIRLHFSNYLGAEKLVMKSVHIAKSAQPGTGTIIPETDTVVTFNGKTGAIIPSYGEIISDTIQFPFDALSELAVTIYFGTLPVTLTGHVGSRTFSYIDFGNCVSSEFFSKSFKTAHWYVLSAIDVSSQKDYKATVCFGDSITDGRGTTDDKQNRWTDILAARLQQNDATKNIAVLNQGIGGTCVTSNGVERFTRDVLNQTGIKYLVILYGVNDIIYANCSSDAVINTYKSMISKAHKKGITVYGGTILPFGNASGWNQDKENIRLEINKWIMETSPKDGGFDGFIDFANVMTDSSVTDKKILNKNWNFENDGLHPNATGYLNMGNCIDIDLFTKTSDYLIDTESENDNNLFIENASFFQFKLPQTVSKGTTIEVIIKGSNNGSTGFRSWLTDNSGSDKSNIYLDFSNPANGKNYKTGDFELNFSLKATDTVSFLFFKAPSWDSKMENITVKEVSIKINDKLISFETDSALIGY